MTYERARRFLPKWLIRHVYHFEAMIEERVQAFAGGLAAGARVLDAGAGECRHAAQFQRQRYTGVDLAIGDSTWDYRSLDALADLERLPFPDRCFDAALMVVTIEHLRRPGESLTEVGRVLRPGGRFLVVAPHQWEVHQSPHDFFRFTRHGLEFLLDEAGFDVVDLEAAGGLFRLLARRLLAAITLMPAWLKPAGMLIFGVPALMLPWLDGLDSNRHYTLGYSCIAVRR